MSDYAIAYDKAWSCVWKTGELIAGQEPDGSFYAVMTIEARQVGPRGGIQKPERGAVIRASTASGLAQGIRSLGFSVPRKFSVTRG